MFYSNAKYQFYRQSSNALLRNSILPAFATTIFLSAFLLFSVQPYFTKLVVPKLGGSPGVWSVAMVFFQGVLLLAYTYAHLLMKFLSFQKAVFVHGCVLVFAFVFLPLGLSQSWISPPNEHQELWILGLFASSIGVPFFAVSANAPLLQAWFARSGHSHAEDPYFLYGASNIGSFLSLFLYILAIEPVFSLNTQSMLWSSGYLVLAVSIIGCGALALYFPRQANPARSRSSAHETRWEMDRPLAWSSRLTFLGLSAIPSALTIAITAHITVDIASAPFLWVVPLALFLLTFVLAFSTRQVVRVEFLARLLPWVAILIASSLLMGASLRVFASLGFNLIGFFAAALYCHALLYKLRPGAIHLTEFYLWISCGGVLGGLFAGLIAPQIFGWVAEYPLLWFLTVLVVLLHGQSFRARTILTISSGVVLAFGIYQLGALELNSELNDVASRGYLLLFLLVSVAVLQMKARLAAVPVLFAAAAVTALQFGTYDELVSHRSFFGITKVRHSDDGAHRIMVHGTTVHGAMRVEDTDDAGPEALTYYHETGEMAAALKSIQNRMGGHINEGAIIGLGTGSFLCHRRPEEKWAVFEIDPSVIKVASDPRYFQFVSDCAPDARMVLGDARQTLAREPNGRFDYVLIDAFSSNAIPMHLLTREALQLYFSKISEDGLLVMHIENRKIELASVVAAIAEIEGWSLRVAKFKNNDRLATKDHVYPTHVAVLARAPEALGDLAADPDWKSVSSGDTSAWTDDYSNILSALFRKYWNTS